MRIFFATPCHRASVEKLRAMHNWILARIEGAGLIGTEAQFAIDCPWLDAARADLVAGFLKSPCDAMIWRDDDVEFGDEVVTRLVEWAPPVAIVPYRLRAPPHRFAHKIDAAGKVRSAGMGATWIRRDAVERLIAENPGLLYDQDGDARCALFHHTFVEDYDQRLRPIRRLAKEDESFFLRVRAAGYEIDVLAGAQVYHAGIPSLPVEEAAAQ